MRMSGGLTCACFWTSCGRPFLAHLRFRPITCSFRAFCGKNGQLAQMLAAANSQPHEGGVFGVRKQPHRIYEKLLFQSSERRGGPWTVQW